MTRHTQYSSPFHYSVSNFKHIYLERIVNTLFHLWRCHQTASPSIYGVHLLFSFVFIFLMSCPCWTRLDMTNDNFLLVFWYNNRHTHDQLHISKKESQFIFVNPFTTSWANFSTPQTEKRAQLLSKRLMECQDVKYVFIPYNPE